MIHEQVEQNTDAWWKAKLGRPSASGASKIITQDMKPSKQREGYMYELVAERITGFRVEGYQNEAMLVGQQQEDEARKLYELVHDCEVLAGGVIYADERKRYLCSPDGVIDGSHGLELKNPLPKTQVKYLIDGGLPSEYFAQVQFSIMVSGFPFWDFMSYSPGLKPLYVRVEPNMGYISALRSETERLCDEIDAMVERLR